MTSNQPSPCPSSVEATEPQAGEAQFVQYLLSDNPAVGAGVATILRDKAIPAVMNVVLSAVIARARSRRPKLRGPAIRALEEMRPFVEWLKRVLFRKRGEKTGGDGIDHPL